MASQDVIIAEFSSMDDAVMFLKMKGREWHELTGGQELQFAVRQKRTRLTGLGRSDQPPDEEVEEQMFEEDDDGT